MDQGEISERLESIYLFCLRHLQQARFDRDVNKLEQVSGLLGELREAWATIAGPMSSAETAPYEALARTIERELELDRRR